MSTDGSRNPARSLDELSPQSSNGWVFFALLLVVAAGGYLFAQLFQMQDDDDRHIPFPGPSQIGVSAPPIRAQGWFNGEPPTQAELQGKIILIDAWAYWCGPCRRKAPRLIRLYEEFAPQGVVFLGLTSEGEDSLDRSREFIEELRIPWRQGYGAVETLSGLKADFIPQVWVIDQNGTIAWDQTAAEDVDVTLRRLLK